MSAGCDGPFRVRVLVPAEPAIVRVPVPAAPAVVRTVTPGPQGPEGPPGRDGDSLPALVAGVLLERGTPVAISRATKQLLPARANLYPLAFVLGLMSEDTQPGFASSPRRGPIALTDWTAIAGTPALAPGQPYFLALAGGLTATPDLAAACVCRVGTAITPTTLVVDPQPPILL